MNASAGTFGVTGGGPPGVFRLVGELDLAGAADLEKSLDGEDGSIIFDCSDLTFIDSAGLSVFVAVHKACRARDAKLTLMDPSPRVLRLLELTGLDSVLNVCLNGSAS
jgi:anti-sigma B factor antagonist